MEQIERVERQIENDELLIEVHAKIKKCLDNNPKSVKLETALRQAENFRNGKR